MSRIYDALERANAGSGSAAGLAPLPAPLPAPLSGVALVLPDGPSPAGEFPQTEGPAAVASAAAVAPVPSIAAAAAPAAAAGAVGAVGAGGAVVMTSPTSAATRPSGTLFEHIDARLTEKVVLNDNMPLGPREQYRRLAGVLHDAQSTTGLRVVMVASAVAGEGKTLTAANLALTLSESYRRRVLLIDADLRRPTLHQMFTAQHRRRPERRPRGADDDKLVVAAAVAEPVAAAGRPADAPIRWRRSSPTACGSCSPRRARRFDWVIIDTPPLVLLPDAHLLGVAGRRRRAGGACRARRRTSWSSAPPNRSAATGSSASSSTRPSRHRTAATAATTATTITTTARTRSRRHDA